MSYFVKNNIFFGFEKYDISMLIFWICILGLTFYSICSDKERLQ